MDQILKAKFECLALTVVIGFQKAPPSMEQTMANNLGIHCPCLMTDPF